MSLIEDHSGGLALTSVSADEMLERMRVLSRAEGAVDLRIGEMLATLKELDLRLLGYSTFGAFLTEEVDFDPSWARQLVRLARSSLGQVKVALCGGAIPISAAVKAPGQVGVGEELDWIESVRSGDWRQTPRARRARVDLEDPADVRVVVEAKQVARTVIGVVCTEAFVEAHILRCWHKEVDGAQLVREASEPPEPPAPDPVAWADDAAGEVLGARVIPTDVHNGLLLLREVLALRRTRRVELGFLYQALGERQRYRELGFDSLAELVYESLPLTQRTLQNYQQQAEALSFYPELQAALVGGMDSGRLMKVFDIATEDNVTRWLEVAKRTTLTELGRAVQWAVETVGEAVLERYERAIRDTNDAHTWVALKAARRPEPVPRRLEGVHPDFVEACRWYKDNVRLPKQTGFAKVKERERFVCESPLCNRRTLRCDAHHKRRRADGGGDEDWNAANLCKPCHLRGVHANGMYVLTGSEHGPDVWTYPNGRRVMVF